MCVLEYVYTQIYTHTYTHTYIYMRRFIIGIGSCSYRVHEFHSLPANWKQIKAGGIIQVQRPEN